MTRVDTSQMLNGLMHVQMNQPMGATRYKNICMEKKKKRREPSWSDACC